MSYELNWEPRGVVKRFFGLVTSKELLNSSEKTEADLRFDDLRYVINDFLACTEFTTDPGVLEELAAIDSAAAMINPGIKIAVVTTSDTLIAVALQYADSPLNTFPTRIFSTLDEARAWIGNR